MEVSLEFRSNARLISAEMTMQNADGGSPAPDDDNDVDDEFHDGDDCPDRSDPGEESQGEGGGEGVEVATTAASRRGTERYSTIRAGGGRRRRLLWTTTAVRGGRRPIRATKTGGRRTITSSWSHAARCGIAAAMAAASERQRPKRGPIIAAIKAAPDATTRRGDRPLRPGRWSWNWTRVAVAVGRPPAVTTGTKVEEGATTPPPPPPPPPVERGGSKSTRWIHPRASP